MVWSSLPISISMKNNLTKYVPFNNNRFFSSFYCNNCPCVRRPAWPSGRQRRSKKRFFFEFENEKCRKKTFCFFFWNRQQKMENIFSFFVCFIFVFGHIWSPIGNNEKTTTNKGSTQWIVFCITAIAKKLLAVLFRIISKTRHRAWLYNSHRYC